MRKGVVGLTVCFINSFLTISLFGQNLIPNGSLENPQHLPCNLNGATIDYFLDNWSQPLPTTTDYWNSDVAESCDLNPAKFPIDPRSGSGMVGIITAQYVRNFETSYREYLQVKLLQSLLPGRMYTAHFYVRNRNSKLHTADILESNNLGIAISEEKIGIFGDQAPDHLFLTPVINNDEIVPANEGWHKIAGCFTADKPAQYLLIGNFLKPEQTEFRRLTSDSEEALAYYFIDDIFIAEVPFSLEPLVNDVVACPDEELVALNAFIPEAIAYQWNTGASGPSINVPGTLTANYEVAITFSECVLAHTFYLKSVRNIGLGPDTTLCFGESIVLVAGGDPNEGYLWSDGSRDNILQVTSPGTYWVSAVSNSCVLSDTVTVDYIPCPGFIPNVITPNGDDINEYFNIGNIEGRTWHLRILNRWGREVFCAETYNNKWNATGVADGIYYYVLTSDQPKKRIVGWLEVTR